ncbi:MAG: AI-2E family transporter [Bdellovibrionales bacterium]|nr:AI-2E family transporter [Bdellovibrionales bacterium]
MNSEFKTLEQGSYQDRIRWYLIVVALIGLACGLYILVRPFFLAILWAAIVVIGVWPLHSRLLHVFPERKTLLALVSALFIIVLTIFAVTPVIASFGTEIESSMSMMEEYLTKHETKIKKWTEKVPYIGKEIVGKISRIQVDGIQSGEILNKYAPSLFGTATAAAQGILSILFNFAFFILATFFLFQHGQEFAKQLKSAFIRVDARAERLIRVAYESIVGTLYGTVLTAIAQGILAGIGFGVAGASAPVLVGFAVMLGSFVPYGPPFIYLPGAALLVFAGSPVWHGVLLALWGICIVSFADNIIKPLAIAGQIELPLSLVLIGVIGGVLAYGFIGVFVGPIIMAITQALWLTWLDKEKDFSSA